MNTLKRNYDPEQIQSDFKKVAWFYNLWSLLTESKAAKKVIQFADIHNGEDIIEIACGTGVVFKEIVKRNPNGHNLGVDLSRDMLSKAEKLLKNEPKESYDLRQGDIFKLRIKNQSYDKLINNFMIDLMPEDKFDFILSEFYRIIKPGGIVVISTFSIGRKKVNKIWVWIAKHIPKVLTNCRPVDLENMLDLIGFEILEKVELSQNTFPSKVYKLRRPISLSNPQ